MWILGKIGHDNLFIAQNWGPGRSSWQVFWKIGLIWVNKSAIYMHLELSKTELYLTKLSVFFDQFYLYGPYLGNKNAPNHHPVHLYMKPRLHILCFYTSMFSMSVNCVAQIFTKIFNRIFIWFGLSELLPLCLLRRHFSIKN